MTEYWYLFAMLVVIVLLLSFDPASKGMGGSKILSPAQLPSLQSRDHAVIIDLNEKDRFKKGHISQSINIPFSRFSDSLGKLKKYQKKPVVLACETGADSKKAVSILKKNEFADVYVLSGGLSGWKKENLPLEKG
ncbi:MAG: rhodanese-like domain-containing protein [Gammaproteobacteria bacterium]|nr:rhodanese-like domain-containing protein [Gammaproteobacteria bacterium]